MDKSITILILVIIGSFLFLSISFSQERVGVGGVVLPTPENTQHFRHKTIDISAEPATPIGNKYLNLFKATMGLQAEKDEQAEKAPIIAKQSANDRLVSYGLMVFVMFVFAILIALIIRYVDKNIFHHTL